MKRRRQRARQLQLRYRRWGGRRTGAGRKRRLAGRKRVPHRTRQAFAGRFPLHVTTRIRDDIPRLRNRKRCKVIRAALWAVMDEVGFRVCEFSVQANHLHLVCEADDRHCLGRGMKRLKQRIARGINRQLGNRKGSVFFDRYHVAVLRSPRQTRNALCYVLHNARRHGERLPAAYGGIDPYSSAWWFDGWADASWRSGIDPPTAPRCTSAAESWLLRVGWRRHGELGLAERPVGKTGSRRAARRA